MPPSLFVFVSCFTQRFLIYLAQLTIAVTDTSSSTYAARCVYVPDLQYLVLHVYDSCTFARCVVPDYSRPYYIMYLCYIGTRSLVPTWYELI